MKDNASGIIAARIIQSSGHFTCELRAIDERSGIGQGNLNDNGLLFFVQWRLLARALEARHSIKKRPRRLEMLRVVAIVQAIDAHPAIA